MSVERDAWSEEERRQSFRGMVDVLNNLIVTINAQSDRHTKEIETLAHRLEENTEAVRECMTDLVKFNAERSNMIKACMDLRGDQKESSERIHKLENENAKLNERWSSLRMSVATGFTICGLVIAVVKMI